MRVSIIAARVPVRVCLVVAVGRLVEGCPWWLQLALRPLPRRRERKKKVRIRCICNCTTPSDTGHCRGNDQRHRGRCHALCVVVHAGNHGDGATAGGRPALDPRAWCPRPLPPRASRKCGTAGQQALQTGETGSAHERNKPRQNVGRQEVSGTRVAGGGGPGGWLARGDTRRGAEEFKRHDPRRPRATEADMQSPPRFDAAPPVGVGAEQACG